MAEKETIDRKAFLALQARILLLEQKVEELERIPTIATCLKQWKQDREDEHA